MCAQECKQEVKKVISLVQKCLNIYQVDTVPLMCFFFLFFFFSFDFFQKVLIFCSYSSMKHVVVSFKVKIYLGVSLEVCSCGEYGHGQCCQRQR